MNPIKYLNKTFFAPVNPLDVANTELLQAKLELLRAETGVDYSIALVEYNKKRVLRPENYITRVTTKAA